MSVLNSRTGFCPYRPGGVRRRIGDHTLLSILNLSPPERGFQERGFAEVVSLAQMTPGPLRECGNLCWLQDRRRCGRIVATFSVIAAPLLVLGLALFLISRASEKWKTRVDRLQRALRPAVSGMLFAAFWMVARSLTGDWRLWVMTAGVFMLIGQEYFKRYPQLLLLIAGMAGVLFL